MKKVFSILMVALFATAMVACGDKNEGTDNPSGGPDITTDALPGGYYINDEEGESGWLYTILVTNSDGVKVMSYGWSPNHYPEEGEEDHAYNSHGNYRYSATAATGSVDFDRLEPAPMQQNVGTATFTYDTEKHAITITFLGETRTLVQQGSWD